MTTMLKAKKVMMTDDGNMLVDCGDEGTYIIKNPKIVSDNPDDSQDTSVGFSIKTVWRDMYKVSDFEMEKYKEVMRKLTSCHKSAIKEGGINDTKIK